ncbi:MAG: S1C family serine protease, partial [Patescibacteria group bacterium]
GIVSALHRRLEHSYLEDHIQTDCPINFGNSGSPLFNESGEVVGINQRIVRDTEGLNFAVSINVARVDLLRKGHIETPSIGFDCLLANFPRKGRSQRPHPEDIKFLRERIGMSVENCFVLAKDSYSNCAIITDFLDPRGKPGLSLGAKDFGLEMGDLVISLDGEVIKNGMDVRMFLVGKQAGDIVKVRFRRAENGKMVDRTIPVSLTPRPSKI